MKNKLYIDRLYTHDSQLCECSFPLNRLVLAELAGVCEEQTIIDFLKSHPEGKSASNQRRSSSQVSIKGLETVELVSMKVSLTAVNTLIRQKEIVSFFS